MSLHYDFALACDLKPDTPQQVLDTLAYMTRTEDYEFGVPPDHEFFAGTDWRILLRAFVPSDSFDGVPEVTLDSSLLSGLDQRVAAPEQTYFPGDLGSSFRRAYRFHQNGVARYRHTLSFRCYWLDDTFAHSWTILEWLAPYSESQGCVGYFRTEHDYHPTLIYFDQGTFGFLQVEGAPTFSKPNRDT